LTEWEINTKIPGIKSRSLEFIISQQYPLAYDKRYLKGGKTKLTVSVSVVKSLSHSLKP